MGNIDQGWARLPARLAGKVWFSGWAAAEAATATLALGLARQVAGEGIRVSVVHPGIMDADIDASGGR